MVSALSAALLPTLTATALVVRIPTAPLRPLATPSRSATVVGCASDRRDLFALPPAASRDLFAEVQAGVRSTGASDRAATPPPPPPLLALSVTSTDGFFSTLVGEHVQNITSGNMAGATWMRPLAMKSERNATLGRAAATYDPAIGFMTKQAGDTRPELHLFSADAPAAFVPTWLVRPAAGSEAMAVRLMHEAHGSADHVDDAAVAEDRAKLANFVSYLAGLTDSPDDTTAGS